MTPLAERLADLRRYHALSTHRPRRFAPMLGFMDWDTQPDPFRRYGDAPRAALPHVAPGPRPGEEEVLRPGALPPRALDLEALGQLLGDSLGLTAWKRRGEARWALRANPSSGNLHPSEAYLLLPELPGLEGPGLFHYRPDAHALELRRRLDPEACARLLPAGGLLLGVSSIAWRESWKYGLRAYRYCLLDAGHALACVALAASCLGWRSRRVEGVGDAAMAELLGLAELGEGPEAERPEFLLELTPGPSREPREAGALQALAQGELLGRANRLSPDHHPWPGIERAVAACRDEGGVASEELAAGDSLPPGPTASPRGRPLRELMRQRRSVGAMDGESALERADLERLLARVLPRPGERPALEALGRPARVHLLLFVHRVEGLEPGLYLLPRRAGAAAWLREQLRSPELTWEPCGVEGLVLLRRGPCGAEARAASCDQALASDGALAIAMLAEFAAPLAREGPAAYRRLHEEAGALGQLLYLEAEAAGLRGTGMGCFLDDEVHRLLGLGDDALRDLYHFAIGGSRPVPGVELEPPYPG